MNKYGLIYKPQYVYESNEQACLNAICEYEIKQKIQCDLMDIKVGYNVLPKEGEDRINNNKLITLLNSEEYIRIYVLMPAKVESDYFRENAYPKQERYAHKNNVERFAEEWHYRDERIQTVPMTDKSVDSYLFWLTSQVNAPVDIVYIDPTEGATSFKKKDEPTNTVRAVSITAEYFAPKSHDDELTQHERNWATVLGYEGNDRKNIKWLLEQYTEDEMYAFANGMDIDHLGTTADTQIVKCPECGEPTFAAPAMQAFTNSSNKAVPYDTPNQMRCEHCGASLYATFNFNEGEIVNLDYLPSEKDLEVEEN